MSGLVHQHRKEWPITILCKTMKINRSYYYALIANQNNKSIELNCLEIKLIALFKKHRENYGTRRLVKALLDEGFKVGHYQIRSLMKKHALKVKQKIRYKNTTDSSHDLKVSENFSDR